MLTDQFDDLSALKRYVGEKFPDAKPGAPSNRADTGEEYVELSLAALSRPSESDMAIVSRFVVSKFSHMLTEYLDNAHGQIYWRIPLEDEWIDASQVVAYDPNGPDIDFYTDKPCFLDRNWKRYNVYCRLLRSDKPVKVAA